MSLQDHLTPVFTQISNSVFLQISDDGEELINVRSGHSTFLDNTARNLGNTCASRKTSAGL